ncbi:MAG: hypothetical protein K0U47_05965 [Epsilonproteobacteria bacterium]|nr:hypothetical protein [Campylobacterota bacterium]
MYQKEYRILSDFEEDAVGQWLKLAKARGETKDSDEVLMTLLVELHKKVDQLTALVKNEERTLLPLEINENIAEIGFEHIKLENRVLEVGKEYYCRIDMPVFPKREMPMFVKAIDQNIAQITLIHDKDEKDWNAYVTARERIMIREMRAQQ